MAVCTQCLSAVRKLRPHDKPLEPRKHGVKIHVLLRQYRNLLDIRCWICYKFFKWLELEDPEVLKTWRQRPLRVKFQPYSHFDIKDAGSDYTLGPLLIEILLPEYTKGMLGCEIELNFIDGDDLATGSAIAPKFGGKGTPNLNLICNWFNQCIKNHEKCTSFRSQWFPTRLVYLGSGNHEVKLIISADTHPSGPYISLSHRWGTQKYTKLKTWTMRRLQQSINVKALPQVFQDAIKIARFLGISYVWIDALCIKQDANDSSDWEFESAKMGKVYSHAVLNISATLSHDGYESLFDQEPQNHILPSKIKLKHEDLSHTYYLIDGDIWRTEIDEAPLNNRGWVFQERFLATRVLHFGRHQLGWECLETEALEMFPDGFSELNVMTSRVKSSRKMMEEEYVPKPGEHPESGFVAHWNTLVNAYSKNDLTFSTDKLMAFAGIASSIMETRTDRYTAGMWEKTLLYHLPWKRDISDRERYPIRETSKRAPSWSWASVDGEIIFPFSYGGVRARFAENLQFIGTADGSSLPLGGASSIRLEGLCFPIKMDLVPEEDSEVISSFDAEGFHFATDHDEPLGTITDTEIPPKELLLLLQQKKLFLTPLYASAYFFQGLLLSPIQEADSYSRLGSIQIKLKKANSTQRSRDGLSPSVDISQQRPGVEQESSEERAWNMDAIRFVYHCLAQSKMAHTIFIS